jgi:hypothetical protein
MKWRRVIFPEPPDEKSICAQYVSRLKTSGIEYSCPYSEIREERSRKVREDLGRTVGARRLEFGQPGKVPESDQALLSSLLRVVMFLGEFDPAFRYRQTMIDLVIPFYHATFCHFGGAELPHVEAICAHMFHRFMTQTKHIKRVPGAPKFDKRRRNIETSIIECAPDDWKGVINASGMVRVTAVKWFVTMFVQDFRLPDVLRIWDCLIADTIDGFKGRLAKMCRRVFTLVPVRIDAGDEEIMEQLSGALGRIIDLGGLLPNA